MARHHTVSGWTQERGYYQDEREFTGEEETARDAEGAQFLVDQAAAAASAAAKAAAKQRGVDKLTALGLTADEIAALLQ